MKQISRRAFIHLAGMALTLPAMTALAAESSNSKRPNLLVIHTDQHNFRTLGCYRETLPPEQAFMWGKDAVVETPNIDWLARNGAICTRFYATSPVCSPSRATFVSGQYPQNTHVVANQIAMSDDVITFAEILSRAGYSTGYAGKWHLNGKRNPDWAPERRFGFKDNRYMFNSGHWKQLEDTPDGPRVKAREDNRPSTSVLGADEKSYTTDWLADKTVDFISSNSDKPFCYMLGIPDPHPPYSVRPPYDIAYKGMTFRKPHTYSIPEQDAPEWATEENFAYSQSQYFGMVKCIDDNVGKILACLRDTKLIESTIVVFTSDHGSMLAEHNREHKGVPFEASARIPFVIYYPARIPAGTVVTAALGTVDFLPTILGLMDVATAGKEEGQDAGALFTGGKPAADWKDTIFVRGSGTGEEDWVAAFTVRYKLIVSPRKDPWLIDRQQDPDEIRNFCFAPAYRQTVQTLAKELLDYGRKYNDEHVFATKVATTLERLASGTEQLL